MPDTPSLRAAAEALLALVDERHDWNHREIREAHEALRASLDSPPGPLAREHEGGGLRWSKDPGADGWYWVTLAGGTGIAEIERWIADEDGDYPFDPSDLLFAGPLHPPSEETP